MLLITNPDFHTILRPYHIHQSALFLARWNRNKFISVRTEQQTGISHVINCPLQVLLMPVCHWWFRWKLNFLHYQKFYQLWVDNISVAWLGLYACELWLAWHTPHFVHAIAMCLVPGHIRPGCNCRFPGARLPRKSYFCNSCVSIRTSWEDLFAWTGASD